MPFKFVCEGSWACELFCNIELSKNFAVGFTFHVGVWKYLRQQIWRKQKVPKFLCSLNNIITWDHVQQRATLFCKSSKLWLSFLSLSKVYIVY